MITAFDPTNVTNYILPDDEGDNPTIFKVRGLNGREFIKYKGMLNTDAFDHLSDSDKEIDLDNPTEEDLKILRERTEVMNKYYADNLDSFDFVLDKGLVGWDNSSVVFDDEKKIDYLNEKEYMAIASKIVNLSVISEKVAKK